MRAAVDGANVIGKTENIIAVGINAPLQGHFHDNAIPFAFDVDNVAVEGVFFAGHVGDIFANTAFVAVGFNAGDFGTAIAEGNLHPGIEIAQLPEPTRYGTVVKLHRLRKNGVIR